MSKKAEAYLKARIKEDEHLTLIEISNFMESYHQHRQRKSLFDFYISTHGIHTKYGKDLAAKKVDEYLATLKDIK